jgi:hypothetical protein
MQEAGTPLQVIQEVGSAACNMGRAKEVDRKERQDE